MKFVVSRAEMKGIIVFYFLARYEEAIADISIWLSEGKMTSKEHVIEGIENFPID